MTDSASMTAAYSLRARIRGVLRHQVVVAVLRASIGVALVAWLTARDVLEWEALRPLVRQGPIVAGALAVLFVDLVITSSRVTVLLRAVGFRLSIAAATRLSLIGLFFNLFLPGGGGGDLVRIYYAVQGNPGRRTEVTTIFVLDRVCGAYAMVLFPVLLFPFMLPLLEGLPVVRWLMLGATALVIGGPLVLWALLHWGRLAVGTASRFGRAAALAVRAFETAATFKGQPIAIARAVLLSLVAHGLSVIIMLMLAEAMLAGGADPRMALLIPLGYVANTLPITPGGLGVGEAALDGLFRLAGLAGGAELLLAWRLLLVVPALLGLAVFVQGRRRWVEPSQAGASS